MTRKFWEKFGIFASILGLIVDCITLWGFVGERLNIEKIKSIYVPSPFPISYHRLLFITTAAILILCYIVLVIFLARNNFPHLCDKFTAEPFVTQDGERSDNPLIAAFEFGIIRTKQHIGLYSLLMNLGAISPIVLLWLRAYFFFPSDDYVFLVSLVALVFGAISILFIPKFSKNPKIKEVIWVAIILEILALVIVAYGFTNWDISYSLYFSLGATSVIIIFILLAKALRNMLIFVTLTYDNKVPAATQMEFVQWLAEKTNAENKESNL